MTYAHSTIAVVRILLPLRLLLIPVYNSMLLKYATGKLYIGNYIIVPLLLSHCRVEKFKNKSTSQFGYN